ncbi:putative major allergen asp f 2 protein [Neofusicoccum parvum]|uniref:Major allergen asp f 2 protein n=1 Tax=Neofusicoccum parvum TaxID=310453 RepID=A0ACB5SNS4_9PEZI|nr:putative major allergen asp f 2 protein [Neofusicoccum parvum]GME65112.1 putative major allergen asp f 2 protein [Neofusicoccum parvum]
MKQALSSLLLAGLAFTPLVSAASPRARREVVTVTETITGYNAGPTPWDWAAGATTDYPIHSSCNGTERALLTKGLNEAIKLAQHAKEHILRFGNSSEFYTKYFGDAPTGEAIGWFEKLISGDRGGIWFRCDDIDGNCHQDGWGGHWRGENATEETVICPLSYTTRMPLEGMCGYGYTVASGKLNVFFAADLIHRLYHLPKIGETIVEHYADTYAECLELAKSNPTEAVRNTHSLQYFALDVYAYDIALPGEGCTGKDTESSSSSSSAAASSTPAPTSAPATTAAASVSAQSAEDSECHSHSDGVVHCIAEETATPTSTTAEAVSTTADAAAECHTHADGVVHCA